MATLSTLADKTLIAVTELYAKYTGTGIITVSLTAITAAGAGSTEVAGNTHTIACESTGMVIVLDAVGRRAGILGPHQAVAFRAVNVNQDWQVEPVPRLLQLTAGNVQANAAATPTLGTTAPTGATGPAKWMKVIGEDGVLYVSPLWTKV